MRRRLWLVPGAFVLGLGVDLTVEALHPHLAVLAVVSGVFLMIEGSRTA